jgi:L-2-hydroxyglutarate oxidase
MIRPNNSIVIIGGGIVGLATAYHITRRLPDYEVVVLEKESKVAAHQSGRNSGVLHSGIYYKPGSLKANYCREGKRMMEEFCAEHQLPYEICGKVIVAVTPEEVPVLEQIYARGQQNQVRCQLIGPAELQQLEPNAVGLRAIHVPEAGIVDFAAVCRKLAQLIEESGGRVILATRVVGIERRTDTIVVRSAEGAEFPARFLINCAGLHSDRITRMAGDTPPARIVPFRGEYYELRPEARHLVCNLIYPVPNPQFPFLGVHFTRMITGAVECGPNAVWAFAREGYSRWNVRWRDLWDAISYPGFRRLCRRYWREGWQEMRRSFSKRLFHAALQRLVPAVNLDDLVPARAGVRAQAVAQDGTLIDDFLFVDGERTIHVCNAPSPAATSSLRIGLTVVERLERRLG